jgi:hypothetical protein
MHIVELHAENVKRLKAITIRPSGNVVVIAGRNGQGKTSTLDAIEMLLAGNKALPPDPVRHGAGSARIVADLGELVVEKTISSKGTQLVVKNADGKKLSSPQTILDQLCSKVAFDPLEFSRMDPKKQDAVLKQVLGIDFSELDADHATIYERRTELNRTVKQLEAKAAGLTEHKDAPAAEVSVVELMAELERRQACEAEKADLEGAAQAAAADVAANEETIERQRTTIADLEQQLVAARDVLRGYEDDLVHNRAHQVETRATADAYTFDDPADIKAQLQTVEETNRQVRANAERKAALAAICEARDAARACTEALEGIEGQKAARLAAAEFPVAGLGFSDVGPTLDGVPLEQASAAQRLRLSVAIGAALNPRLKVLLVREGAYLDDDSMQLLAQLADEQGCQVWLERVGGKDPGAVIIEDGEVLDAEAAAE